MIVQISFKQMSSSDAVKAYAEEKSEKLKKYFNGRIHVTWNFSIEKQVQVAHCHLVGNDMDYFGQSENDNLFASVDETVTKIEKQLRKHKEIVKDHLHRSAQKMPKASGE